MRLFLAALARFASTAAPITFYKHNVFIPSALLKGKFNKVRSPAACDPLGLNCDLLQPATASCCNKRNDSGHAGCACAATVAYTGSPAAMLMHHARCKAKHPTSKPVLCCVVLWFGLAWSGLCGSNSPCG